MTIDENIEMLDDIIEHAQSDPFSVKKGIVDIDQVRDCLNAIRMSIPQEVKQAKLIVQDRKSIMEEAKKEEENQDEMYNLSKEMNKIKKSAEQENIPDIQKSVEQIVGELMLTMEDVKGAVVDTDI